MKTKSKNYDWVECGIKFRVLDEDYDFCRSKSVPYKLNKHNLQRALEYKGDMEHDFTYADYDCTGSTQVRIEVKIKKLKKRKYIYVYHYWDKDV